MEFERDLAEVTAAPDADFADVTKLHRPQLSAVEGIVRVSRLGETGTISTRSGTVIGQRVHFYHDISSITAAEDIEMQVIGEYPGLSTVVDDILSSTTVDIFNAADINISENDLLDTFGEDFSNTHLVVTFTDDTTDTVTLPITSTEYSVNLLAPDVTNSVIVSFPNNNNTNIIYSNSLIPLAPTYIDDIDFDFFLHPGLLPKKRRRLDIV